MILNFSTCPGNNFYISCRRGREFRGMYFGCSAQIWVWGSYLSLLYSCLKWHSSLFGNFYNIKFSLLNSHTVLENCLYHPMQWFVKCLLWNGPMLSQNTEVNKEEVLVLETIQGAKPTAIPPRWWILMALGKNSGLELYVPYLMLL